MTQTPDEAEALQRKYRSTRKRWARKIGRPYGDDIERPPPGELDLTEDDEWPDCSVPSPDLPQDSGLRFPPSGSSKTED